MTCLPQALLKSAVFVYAADLGFKAKPINLHFMTRIYIQPLRFTFLLCVLRFSFVFYVFEKMVMQRCFVQAGLGWLLQRSWSKRLLVIETRSLAKATNSRGFWPIVGN